MLIYLFRPEGRRSAPILLGSGVDIQPDGNPITTTEPWVERSISRQVFTGPRARCSTWEDESLGTQHFHIFANEFYNRPGRGAGLKDRRHARLFQPRYIFVRDDAAHHQQYIVRPSARNNSQMRGMIVLWAPERIEMPMASTSS